MSKPITRRELLKFTGGSIIGLMFSPFPWKLLDDSSIWTQNWSLTPKLQHGPITSAFTHCTLCPAGCALKAQCVSGMPFALAGVPSHPLTHGSICARGLGGHHMAFHPLRIVHPHAFSGKSENSTMSAVSLQHALDAVSRHISSGKGTIAILDRQPNRAVSELYRSFLDKTGRGMYLTSPSREESTLGAVSDMLGTNTPLGYDLENAAMILSFGASLLDGWGIPGKMTALRNKHTTMFVQIDSRYSRTAQQADQWIANAPGTERLTALSIASVMVEENLISQQTHRNITDYLPLSKLLPRFTPERTSSVTGIDAAEIRTLARKLSQSNGAIVLAGADAGGGPLDSETERTIAAINILLGSVGKTGGIVARNEVPGYFSERQPVRWSSVPDHSIETLIIDGSDSGYAVPWQLIEQKLVKNTSLVISLSPVLDQMSVHSDFLIPSPAHLESLQDVVSGCDSSISTFALSIPLISKNENTTEPADVLRELSNRLNLSLDIPAPEETLKTKVTAIHNSKRGTLFTYADNSTVPVSDVPSPDDLWIALSAGAVWMDEETKQTKMRTATLSLNSIHTENLPQGSLLMIAAGWRGAVSTSQISPIMSKVFQETELRHVNGIVSVNPVTAKQFGLSQDSRTTISTSRGSAIVRIVIDTAIRPGVVEASIGPSLNGTETPAHPGGKTLLDLCEVTNDGTWRITPAQFLKV